MKQKVTVLSFLIMLAVCLSLAGTGPWTEAAAKPGPKANAPSIELAPVVQKWISQKKKSDEIETIVEKDFILSGQRVNIVGTVKGTKKIQVAMIPGPGRKGMKSVLIHRLEYAKKGEKAFEYYVVLPAGETYPDGDRLKVTDAFIESNRGYGVKYGVRPVLIKGKVEQLPPD